MTEQKELLKQEELAALLGVHIGTIDRWKKRGCPYINVSHGLKKIVRFDIEQVRAWIKSNAKRI